MANEGHIILGSLASLKFSISPNTIASCKLLILVVRLQVLLELRRNITSSQRARGSVHILHGLGPDHTLFFVSRRNTKHVCTFLLDNGATVSRPTTSALH